MRTREDTVLNERPKDLEEEIKKKGAKWKAEETSISKLSPEEQMKRLGLIPTDEELKEMKKKSDSEKKKQ